MHDKNPSQLIYLNFITRKYSLNEACRYLTLKNEANIHNNSYLRQQIVNPLLIVPSTPSLTYPLKSKHCSKHAVLKYTRHTLFPSFEGRRFTHVQDR